MPCDLGTLSEVDIDTLRLQENGHGMISCHGVFKILEGMSTLVGCKVHKVNSQGYV